MGYNYRIPDAIYTLSSADLAVAEIIADIWDAIADSAQAGGDEIKWLEDLYGL